MQRIEHRERERRQRAGRARFSGSFHPQGIVR